MSFFNGAVSSDIAKLMEQDTGSVTPYPQVKLLASQVGFWDTMNDIIEANSHDPLLMMYTIATAVEELRPGITNEYNYSAVYRAAARVINSGNRKVSDAHGLNSQQKIVNGKIKTVLLEHKPEAAAPAA